MAAATSLEELWRAAPLGKMPALEQLKALALRDAWKEFCKGDVNWMFLFVLFLSMLTSGNTTPNRATRVIQC